MFGPVFALFQGGAGAVAALLHDVYFSAVALLLHGDGANGSATITDSETTPKTLTALGNAQNSTAQFKYGTASLAFDGTGDYITVPAHADFEFGTGDFTIECWWRPTATTTDYQLLSYGNASIAGGADIGFGLAHFGALLAGKVRGYFYNGVNGYTLDTTTALAANTWYHIAYVRKAGTTRLFLNGVQEGTASQALSVNAPTSRTLYIGRYETATLRYANGYMDDLRITKGVARYQSNFTVPAGPLADTTKPSDPWAATNVLLMHCDGANAATFFLDDSPTPKALTAVGSAQLSTAQSKFGSASLAFNGTTDYVTSPAHADFDFGTGDFTIEMWWRPASATVDYSLMSYTQAYTTSTDLAFLIWHNGASSAGKIVSAFANSTTQYILTGTTALVANTWYHIAYVRNGGTTRLFVNGALEATASHALAINTPASRTLRIGYFDTAGARYASGHMDEIRISKGFARYIEAFTPTPGPFLQAVNDFYFPNVSLLMHGNGANGGTVFVDNSPSTKSLTGAGSVQTSTAQFKYGGSSLLFNGTTDYLTSVSHADFEFGTGDFTVELWWRPTSASVDSALVTYANPSTPSGSDYGFAIQHFGALAAGKVYGFFYNGVNQYTVQGTSALAAGTWYHIAYTRASGTTRLFINGTQEATASQALAVNSPASRILTLGRNDTGTPRYANGYMDDLRITKGVARYTANFTPDPVQFSDY